ncbi:MAG TPA: SAM-dependent methyltransferase, partial [Nitrospira sp.]|nr:SAM-dependent methyltransferase [Nitrospira sp.]
MTAKWHNTRYVGQAARKLGWVDSPGFFDAGRFNELPHNALRYACRKAADTSALQGVYLLNDKEGRNHIPVAFLCQADTEQEAREIHRRVWNINLVPFVVVESPTRIRVFQGFKYDARQQTEHAFAAASLTDKVELLDRLAAFRAESIDDGRVFETWGHLVTPTTRVDEHLLGQLQRLDGLLRQLSLSRDASHCLIGKYVWLSYLRARGILSDWRLQKYGIREEDIFSRNAKLTAFHHLDQQLQGWLNGEIFPLRGEDRRAVKSEHLQKVAGVFAGDDADGQLCLFNEFYDFSHLPIETLSVVYEQFLHHKEEGDERSEGEESGAYYTPVCLADFMIAELDRKIPLQDGVAVFDPSCGSGAFLVQAYRRLVERTMHDRGRDLRLKELKDLLEDNIFGVDRDPDACKVARMSLAIALLGYANPPDVSGPVANFKLPTLSENNIRQKDFFELDPSWPRAKDKKPPQWIIGNPPWVELKTAKRPKDKRNQPAWDWLDKNAAKQKASMPVSGNQVAEMFVWRVLDFARDDSVIGLVMPAMTLFKHEAKKFRQAFFGRTGVWCVANFANFMEVLFAGRARQPAACFFYEPSLPDDTTKQKPIATLTPLITDQYSNLSHQPGKQVDTWNIVIRPQDYREVDRHEASKGDRLTWKLAMWASEREKRLMKKIGRFQSFEAWRTEAGIWEPALGPQLRNGPGKDLDLQSELIGKRRLS